MIRNLEISNFKLYKENTIIPLSNINLFTGTNGKGKSSALQIFLLLSQSALKNRTTDKVYLNGSNVNLGNFGDVKNKDNQSSEPIIFSFSYDDFKIKFTLSPKSYEDTDLIITEIQTSGECLSQSFSNKLVFNGSYYDVYDENDSLVTVKFPTTLFDLFINLDLNFPALDLRNSPFEFVKSNLNLNYIHYVSADRMGPKNYYESTTLGHFECVGANGEDTVNILYHKGDEQINSKLFELYCKHFDIIPEETSKTIEDHTNFWMDKIFDGAKIKVESIKGEDLLKLRISSEKGGISFKPTNVGYGFSYSLPIIVSGLIAKPGEILIIENPEAHLHPYAQSIIAKFLSLVSKTGVQVFIESHSDHILNGLRIEVYDQVIKNEDLNVLYFDNDLDSIYTKIEIDSEGGVLNWPEKFFDQATKDLNYLYGM